MATVYRQGDRGAVVKQIQKVVGCYPDGVWGPLTTEGVKAWQAANGLVADGVAGMKTLAKMGIEAAVHAVTPSPKPYAIQYRGITLKKSRRRIDWIAIHCTASREGQEMTVEQIRADHRRQGWADIGYHYVIDLNGVVHLGRDVDLVGAHVKGYNANSIGIVYVGGLENKPNTNYSNLKAKDTRTEKQRNALLTLLMDLRKLYPYAKIQGHRDFSPDINGDGIINKEDWIKDCPSFDAKAEYRRV